MILVHNYYPLKVTVSQYFTIMLSCSLICFIHVYYFILILSNIFQKDVDEAVTIWNIHRIRPTRNQNVPSGKPCILYTMPELYNTYDYAIQVEPAIIEVCKDGCLFNQNKPSNGDMQQLLQVLMDENNLVPPNNVEEGFELYRTLRRLAVQTLNNYQ